MWILKLNDIVSLFTVFAMVIPTTEMSEQNYEDVLRDTELIFVLMVLRHGDRTPEPIVDLSWFGDVNEINALIKPWGMGQLTDVGKKTAYKTGEFIRRRYKDFIPKCFDLSQVYLQSTNMTRTKKTLEAALAAIFPEEEDVPYNIINQKYDDMLSFKNCPTMKEIKKRIDSSPIKIEGYEDPVTKIGIIQNNKNLITMQTRILDIYNTYNSLINLGYDIGDEVRDLIPAAKAAAGKTLDIYYHQHTFVELAAGVIINKFFEYANEITSGKDTPKIRIYSAHDLNVSAMQKGIQVTESPGVPAYGSLIALELRKVIDTGRHIVVPVYMADPHEGKAQLLEVSGCGVLCDYHVLQNLTSKYRLDKHSWIKKCNITDDAIVTVA